VASFAIFFHKIGCHGSVLEISKIGPDRSFASKTLSFDVKIAKIGPADPEIICLEKSLRKNKQKRKKLRKVKYIAWWTT